MRRKHHSSPTVNTTAAQRVSTLAPVCRAHVVPEGKSAKAVAHFSTVMLSTLCMHPEVSARVRNATPATELRICSTSSAVHHMDSRAGEGRAGTARARDGERKPCTCRACCTPHAVAQRAQHVCLR